MTPTGQPTVKCPPNRRRSASVRLAVVVVAAAIVASACGGGDEKTDTTLDLVTTTTSPENLLKLPDPTQALVGLATFLGFDPRLLGVSVSLLNVGARVRNNDDENKVDSYTASLDPTTGIMVWTGPKPIKLSPDDIARLDAQQFTIGDVRWESIPGLAEQGVKQLGTEAVDIKDDVEPLRVPGAGVNRGVVEVGRDPVTGEGVFESTFITISLTVEGTRGQGFVAAEADGTIREVRRT